ncbi:MAG: hypothetical protein WAM70_11530, partial [Pyrinomonadaceae bacterium]
GRTTSVDSIPTKMFAALGKRFGAADSHRSVEQFGEESHKYLQHSKVIQHGGKGGKENHHGKDLKDEYETDGS